MIINLGLSLIHKFYSLLEGSIHLRRILGTGLGHVGLAAAASSCSSCNLLDHLACMETLVNQIICY